MKDAWQSGNAYNNFMGRWSKRTAIAFVDWVSPASNLDWVDIGCGTGALSEAIINRCSPKRLTAIDQSDGFIKSAQERLGHPAICRVGDALDLPLDDNCVDVAVSGLLLNFIPKPVNAVSEMKRVTKSGGQVATYIWDYAGTMEFLQHFWDAAVKVSDDANLLHEGHRFSDANDEHMRNIFNQAGINELATAPIDIETRFENFDDYWNPFLGGQGPAPTFLQSLNTHKKEQLKDLLHQQLPVQADGSIVLQSRAWGIKGSV